MSRIYFHSLEDTAEVRGAERHHAAWITSQLLEVGLGITEYMTDSRVKLFQKVIRSNPRYPLKDAKAISDALAIGGMGDNAKFLIDGKEVSIFSTALNTALAIGSDPIKLLARLHGQCEIWAWVGGPNRAWLAGIIQEGLSVGIMRQETGWESVIALLLSCDTGPVVTSYSVTDSFPCLEMAELGGFEYVSDDSEDDEERYGKFQEGFYDLSYEQRWGYAFRGLRSQPLMEMKPDDWRDYRFGAGYTAFDVVSEMMKGEEGE